MAETIETMNNKSDFLAPPPFIAARDMKDKKEQSESKKIRAIKGVVLDCVKETYDTWTLHIFVGDQNRNYIAGQFVSIDPHQFPELSEVIAYLEHKKGRKEVVRAYS